MKLSVQILTRGTSVTTEHNARGKKIDEFLHNKYFKYNISITSPGGKLSNFVK